MGKRAKKQSTGARVLPARVSSTRLRQGWPGRSGGRIRLMRPGEDAIVRELVRLADVSLDDHLAVAAGDGSLAATLVIGLDQGIERPMWAAALTAMYEAGVENGLGLATMSLVLVAEDRDGEIVAVLVGVPPATLLATMLQTESGIPQTISAALSIAKIQALAVAESARGQGWAGALLRRAWQTYLDLGFFLCYGQFDVARGNLAEFYQANGFAVRPPGEGIRLDVIQLPFGISPNPGEQLFGRWRPRQPRTRR